MSHSYSPASLSSADVSAEHRAWLCISLLPHQTLKMTWSAIDRYERAQAVWQRLCSGTEDPEAAEAKACDLEVLASRRGERIVTPADPEYPRQLFDLPQPPAALFVAGPGRINVSNQIAVIGSRLATSYGMSQAAALSRQLAQHGITVTSGLARGIDAQSHRGALKGQGHTVAVIGCGLDVYYPRENRRLQKQLMSSGNVISEYPYGTPPLAWHFPARNRLIAALAAGTVIVQASSSSGALITANIANDLGREVMVVPGALDVCQSGGCLQLLMEGANPVRHVRDVLDVLHIFADSTPDGGADLRLSEQAKTLLAHLDSSGATIDTLVERSHLGPGLVAAILNQLSLLGTVQRLPEGVWIPV